MVLACLDNGSFTPRLEITEAGGPAECQSVESGTLLSSSVELVTWLELRMVLFPGAAITTDAKGHVKLQGSEDNFLGRGF